MVSSMCISCIRIIVRNRRARVIGISDINVANASANANVCGCGRAAGRPLGTEMGMLCLPVDAAAGSQAALWVPKIT